MAIEQTIIDILSGNEDLVEIVGDRIFDEEPVSPPSLVYLRFDAELDRDQIPQPQTGSNEEDCWDVVVDVFSKSKLEFSQIVDIFRTQIDRTNQIYVHRTYVNTGNNEVFPIDYRGSINFSIIGN